MLQFASLVSFDEQKPGYVKWPNVSVANFYQVSLKFKTMTSNGMIFHVQGKTDSSTLLLDEGRLVFISQGEVLQTSTAGIKFNDNEWHVVTATHNESSLRLDIDDTETYSTDSSPPTLYILYGSLYIGGVPQNIRNNYQNQPFDPFVGQIGDATFNGVIINFANTTERPNALLGTSRASDSG